MKELLICNIITLTVAGIFTTISFVSLLKTEKKLAKLNESKLFENKKENKK